MNRITRIGVSGVGVFKDPCTWTIPKGITYLYGLNKSRGLRNGNGAGKSLLVSSPAEILYDTPMVGTRQDRLKAGTRFMEFVDPRGRTIKILSAYKGKSEKIQITIDGQVKKWHRIGEAKTALASLFPINEEAWRTYCFVDSTNPHPLVRGTATQRKAFFSEFFGLDRIDEEKKLFGAKYTALKAIRAQFGALRERYNEEKARSLNDEDRQQLEAELETIKTRLDELKAQAAQFHKQNQLIEFRKANAREIKRVLALVPNLDADRIATEIDIKDQALIEGAKNNRLYHQYQTYLEDNREYKAKLSEIGTEKDATELRAGSAAYVKAKTVLATLVLDRPDPVDEPSPRDHDREALLILRSKLDHKIGHAQRFGEGVCYECGQPVEIEDVTKLQAKLQKVKSQLKELDTYESQRREYDEYVTALAEYKAARAKAKKLEARMESYAEDHAAYEKVNDIRKPKRPDKIVKTETDVESLAADLNALKRIAPKLELVVEALALKKSSTPFDIEELNAFQERYAQIRTKLGIDKSVRSSLSNLREQLIELKTLLRDEKALQVLLTAYSDKALKGMIIEAISEHLISVVNKYAKSVLPGHTFEMLWSGTQVHIIAHREKGTASDVRKLSGAESKLFTLILLLALLSFVPKAQRCSLLILDEPCASMSAETTAMFHKLLPVIQKSIPSIIVVTPKADERLEGAEEWTVVREKTGAKLVKGHPDTIK